MIIDLELKLNGNIPVSRKDLFELVNSWGRKNDSSFESSIVLKQCNPSDCYDLSNLDISQIDNLSYIFSESLYNGDLSKWDVSNVLNLKWCFNASNFNNDSLKNWNTSNCKNFECTFYLSKFNGNLNGWNLSEAYTIEGIFEESNFNNNSIINWNVSNVENMSYIFNKTKFNQDISNWNISNVKKIQCMFARSDFNGDISSWNFNQNVNCNDFVIQNKNFIDKYNSSKDIPNDTNDFLDWFEDNRGKIKELNTSKEEILDFFSFDSNIELNKDS